MKRPALGRRSASSHAIVSTRTSPSNTTDAPDPPPQKAPVHKAHRAHVVGGGHRTHARNPSFGKNLNKLQRLTSAHVLGEGATAVTGARHHQRKKSAPVTPAGSPRGSHGRGGSTVSSGEHKAHTSMRKNYSTPALARNTSAVLGKKALVTGRPQTAKPRVQKSVGFELGDSDSEEWEDSTQSPESTRRGSVAPSKDSPENNTVLVDPLTFVKRPYPQVPQSRSLPESSVSALPPEPAEHEHSGDEEAHSPQPDDQDEQQQQPPMRSTEHEDIASRLLGQSRPSKAPPAMSSISAMATPAPVDTARRNASLTNLADVSRHGPTTSSSAQQNASGITAQATSSSMEGGVSRFIIDKNDAHATSRTDSDPNTPSSFLPHYHPQTPPSPGRSNTSKKAKTTSPPPRPPGDGPPSRTQQKLWLQRNAALTTSPPDGSPALPPSSIDHSRAGGRPYDGGRGAVNGSMRPGVSTHDSEAKHIRKAYEKTASELNVVRQFQSPMKNSFDRVDRILSEMGRQAGGTEQNTSLAGKSVKSAPSMTNGQFLQSTTDRRQHVSGGTDDSPSGRSQLISKNRQSGSKHAARVYFQDQDDVVNINDTTEQMDRLGIDDSHGQRSALSTSVDAATEQGGTGKDPGSGYFATETAMLLRRMWESREVASPG